MIGGGKASVPYIQRARELGLSVIVSDLDPGAPSFAYADKAVVVSTYDPIGTLKTARGLVAETGLRIDGVLAAATDVPLTVAEMASFFGLPGPSLETARLAADKMAMKDRFKDLGIPIPWYAEVHNCDQLRDMARKQPFPLVLKPCDSRGARGVLLLTERVDLSWAFDHSLSQSPSGRVMVEEHLSGPQISTESIIVGGKGETPGFSDRNYERLGETVPFMIEDGGQQPSVLSIMDQKAVADLTVRAALALGVDNWTAKGDIVLTKEGPKVIEIAARLSGGWFSSEQIPLATGVDFMGIAIRLALGESVSLEQARPQYHRGVAIRYFFPPSGMIREVRGVAKARKLPGVHSVHLFREAGDTIGVVHNHTERAGCVVAAGKDREEAINRALGAVSRVEFVVE